MQVLDLNNLRIIQRAVLVNVYSIKLSQEKIRALIGLKSCL